MVYDDFYLNHIRSFFTRNETLKMTSPMIPSYIHFLFLFLFNGSCLGAEIISNMLKTALGAKKCLHGQHFKSFFYSSVTKMSSKINDLTTSLAFI